MAYDIYIYSMEFVENSEENHIYVYIIAEYMRRMACMNAIIKKYISNGFKGRKVYNGETSASLDIIIIAKDTLMPAIYLK